MIRITSVLLLLVAAFASMAAELPQVEPQDAGFDPSRFELIAQLAEDGIAEGKMPGCVICFGRHGKIAYLEAFGNRQLEDSVDAMTTDTLFDMASITKPVATATSIMKLLETGRLRLADKVTKFFPEFAANGKDEITIQDLLIHQSGLIPDNSLKDYMDGPDVAWQKICELGLVAPVGTTFKYSDVNFIVLAKLIEEISGKTVHDFSQEQTFGPLGMTETGFLPSEELRAQCAPTEKRDDQWIQGEVHDPRAYELGGIAGHAGLFSSARDLAVYADMMLGQGTFQSDDESIQILAPRTFQTMTRGYRVSGGLRGLGWDKLTGYSSNKGDLLSSSAFGHGGFTGTVLWIDPELDLFFIFLSNRVHPDGKGSVNHLAGQILNVVASSLTAASSQEPSKFVPVLTGIDVLARNAFRQLKGQRIGLITNHTGRDQEGISTAKLLAEANNVELTALFSPEHGFEGKLDVPSIEDAEDKSTGLKIFSLYGKTRKPTEAMLASVDTLVFDIQDVGCRFYTYISTMGEAMQAAAEHGKRFVVLDRPNPIGGEAVAGPMLDRGNESFVAFHPLPVRHGMTTGELAMMFRDELELDLDLEVIGCEGWSRADLWDSTNLTWVNPSPNMRCLTQAFLYPGVGLLETTNLSVGRGTDTPFEIVGAPWIDGRLLAAELNKSGIAGATFIPIEFTPDSSKYAKELCHGVNIVIVNRAICDPMEIGFEIARQLQTLHAEQWELPGYLKLLGSESVFHLVRDGASRDKIMQSANLGVKDFSRRRQKYLLY